MPDDKLVLVQTFGARPEADMALSAVSSAGMAGQRPLLADAPTARDIPDLPD